MAKKLLSFLVKEDSRIVADALEKMNSGEWKKLPHFKYSMVWVNLSNGELLFVDVLDIDPEWPVIQPKKYRYLGIIMHNEFIPLKG